MRLTEAEILSRILYRDAEMLVLDKPAGIAVHGGPKGGQTLDDFLPALTLDGPEVPQLAHRLDRETTGCLVLGRTKPALRRLGLAFQKGGVEKTYCALVVGRPAEDEGRIDLPLARRSHDKRSWWMKVDPAGDPSFTRFRVLGRADGLALLALRPETGRTHQLRVHCAAMGWPIAGDRVYGGDRATAAARVLMLHAWAITIPGARKGKAGPSGQRESVPISVTAPLPEAMRIFLDDLGLQGVYQVGPPSQI